MEKFQFNKISLIQLNRDLKVRHSALPVLQNKEAALRAETRRLRQRVREKERQIQDTIDALAPMLRLWAEFPDLVTIQEVTAVQKRIAGVKVRVVDTVQFRIEPVSWFGLPPWFGRGVEIVQQLLRLRIEHLNEIEILDQVEYSRRKTTQKVNLYEKVQIPYFEESIRKIKRFLEDEDNLSKASQKVLKQRMAAAT